MLERHWIKLKSLPLRSMNLQSRKPQEKKSNQPAISSIEYFSTSLLHWYATHGRDFPWREVDCGNYIQVVSEILLQRTKAETVASFLPEFISKYPGWESLAASSESEIADVLKPIGLWKRRAQALHNLSCNLNRYSWEFPPDREKLDKLPAIGQYVGNAIELFCIGRPRPLLDASMARLLERYFGPRKLADLRYDPYLQKLAQRFVEQGEAKLLNWAALDFATLVCKKKKPQCVGCLLSRKCKHFRLITREVELETQ